MTEYPSTPRLVAIDCETTGLRGNHRIVEIAALTLDPETWEPVDEYDTLINPERDVGRTSIHGITPSMVEAAPTFSEVAATLARRLHGAVLIAHNLQFDAGMLRQNFAQIGIEFNGGDGLCTWNATGRLKLNSACRRYGITLKHEHQALADARATAALAREVFDEENLEGMQPARLGYVPFPLDVRTLRRGSVHAGISELARIVSLSYFPCADEALLNYLEALNWILDDGIIDDDERMAINELALELGITDEQRDKAHRSYLSSIIAAARRNHVVTEAENRLIKNVAKILNITDIVLPEVTQIAALSSLEEGMCVCFTGEAIINGKKFDRTHLEIIAAQAGMQPVKYVTKKGCDMLVAGDPSTQSVKARNARKFDVPIMSAADFYFYLR